MMFLDCPAYLDRDGTRRCGLPAEVEHKYTMSSTDGPVDCARISCPAGHWFNAPLDCLFLQAPARLLPEASRRLSQSQTGDADSLTVPSAAETRKRSNDAANQ